jgi:hypothetical protein
MDVPDMRHMWMLVQFSVEMMGHHCQQTEEKYQLIHGTVDSN